MNKTRVPFIVSIGVIGWSLFPHRLMKSVVIRNEGFSLRHPKGYSIREKVSTRCGGHGAWESPLGKWGEIWKVNIDEVQRWERPGVWEQRYHSYSIDRRCWLD